ncbi:ATP dependent DNA ligase [Mesorhizobium sp. ORM6]
MDTQGRCSRGPRCEGLPDQVGAARKKGLKLVEADKGHYMGGAFVTFKADKRQDLWDRVQGKAGAPPPKGIAKEKAEWLEPGLVGRVKFLKGEQKLRHASLKDFREEN